MEEEGSKKEEKNLSTRLKFIIKKMKDEINSENDSEHEFPFNLLFRHHHKIFRYAAIFFGSFLIIVGVLSLLGPSDRVVDNVVFGESAVISAFLILTGLLLLGGATIQSIVQKTSLDKFYSQMKKAESDDEKKKEE